MRDNFIFTEIPEERHEDCEETLRKRFSEKKNHMYDMFFVRHKRLVGKYREYSDPPTPRIYIVAKISFSKKREQVRLRALCRLKGPRFWVNEQFPGEVEERRRKLYPIMG